MNKNCPNCFFPTSEKDLKCPNCGFKLVKDPPPPPDDLPPPPPMSEEPPKLKKEIPAPPMPEPKPPKEKFDYYDEEGKKSNTFKIFLSIVIILFIIAVGTVVLSNKFMKKTPVVTVTEPSRELPQGYSFIPEGICRIGSTRPIFDDEKPTFRIKIDSFLMKTTPVTNEEFSIFVKETGYVTDAEKDSTIGFYTDTTGFQHDGGTWLRPRGPEGPDALAELPDHPVVQITWFDAARYCNWLSLKEGFEIQYDTVSWQCIYTDGFRLPTEYEFEYAAQGGNIGAYPWGDESPGIEKGQAKANHAGYSTVGEYIQDMEKGDFTSVFSHMAKDGFSHTSPVRSFPPNNFGLFDMAGNVWQWCSNYYSGYPPAGSNYNPRGPETGEYKSMRGGSFGHDFRYLRCSARGKNTPFMAIELIGFRTVRSF